ncbi:hypothetical protein TNCV_1749421 [Trichonephila clavipes]|nr:hypothetical protein TNCV_1749421 [Trichonephila clavipes]
MSRRSKNRAETGKERLYPLHKSHTTQTSTVDNFWPILQILDGASAVCQDPDTVLIRVESMIESTTNSNELRSKDKVQSPKSRTVAGGLGRAAMRRPSMSQTCSIGFRSGEHAGHSYAVLFQLQACSPPDELYAVGHYHPGKQRNLNGYSARDDIRSKYLVCIPFGPSKCHSE